MRRAVLTTLVGFSWFPTRCPACRRRRPTTLNGRSPSPGRRISAKVGAPPGGNFPNTVSLPSSAKLGYTHSVLHSLAAVACL
eukprot:1007235-Alexandrium_andersonii.AAC.1